MVGYSPISLKNMVLKHLLRMDQEYPEGTLPLTVAEELCKVRPIFGRYKYTSANVISTETDGAEMPAEKRDRAVARWESQVPREVNVGLTEGKSSIRGSPVYHTSYFEGGMLFRESYNLWEATLPGGTKMERHFTVKEDFKLDYSGRLEMKLVSVNERVAFGTVVTEKVTVLHKGDRM